MDIVKKSFISGKNQKIANDDYTELYINWQIRKCISENLPEFTSDSFLFECIEKVPFLFLTKDQFKILSKAKTLEDEYKKSQIASELKQGIFFEIKGNHNLENLINTDDYKKLSFDSKMKILLDILMGVTLLDRANIIQRDLNCENIQIEISSDGKPKAYLIDFGKAVHTDIIHLFDSSERVKNDYCGPFFYSAPPEAYENKDNAFGDKYNSYNIGLIMLALFFGKNGYDLMYNFKWSSDDDIVKNRKNLFYNLDEIIGDLNRNNYVKYNSHQIMKIKSIMLKLINPDYKKRVNSETVAHDLYQERFGVLCDNNDSDSFFFLIKLMMKYKKSYKLKENNINDESID